MDSCSENVEVWHAKRRAESQTQVDVDCRSERSRLRSCVPNFLIDLGASCHLHAESFASCDELRTQ